MVLEMLEYKLLTGYPEEIELEINELCADGWTLVGQILPVPPSSQFNSGLYCATMER